MNRLIIITALGGTALCGSLGGSPWAVLAGAVMIASQRSEAHFAFADKHGEALGWLPAWGLFAAASIIGSAVQSACAYALGQLFTLLMPALA